MCTFSSTTRPVICRDAVGSTGADDDAGSPARDDDVVVVVVVVGVTGGVNSTRVLERQRCAYAVRFGGPDNDF